MPNILKISTKPPAKKILPLVLGNHQWRYQAIQNGGAEIVHCGQCLHHPRDCGIHSDKFDVQECESCLCSLRRPDKTVWLKSEPADLGKIKWLLIFTRCGNGILTECNDN